MGRKAKKSASLAAAATGLISEAKGKHPKRRRRGRKLLLTALLGLAAVAFKARRKSAAPGEIAPQEPAPPHASKAVPDPTPAPALPDEPPLPDTDAIADSVPPPDPAEATQPLPEPVVDTEVPAAEDLSDIVEEPWADNEVTPIAEPPADSLTSFFDEVMTDTADRKLDKGK